MMLEVNLLELASQYFNPEMLVAVPLLLFIGRQLKMSARVDDTLIVNILCYVGIGIAAIWNFTKEIPTTPHEIFIMILVSVLSGIVLAYTSVGAHQQYKQHKENKINDTDI